MTPAVDAAKKAQIRFTTHAYAHDESAASYGVEAAEKLGVAPESIFKTLVVKLDGKRLAVGLVPVTGKLGFKLIARAAGAKKATMASPEEVERATGYVLGGVSPLGQKKRLPTFIDTSAEAFSHLHVSAGRRGLEIALAPADLAALTQAEFVPLAV
ncbi:Cys-tRNA(Pro) deacylase [Halomonas garicola]|uniref:Cys-tRNA(Pro) deacylase n=1 Tax=Halomonas garicola TaxID=1690008 RepID=UPI0028984E82|nr:Cys-tRNA(Pro) deacylase [Halomonas garicola]